MHKINSRPEILFVQHHTYDMVPQTRIIESLKMYKISNKVIKFNSEAMKNWKVELTAEGKTLTAVRIQRDIFQGDTFPH